ncbi:MAG: tetratricopeptide repeat protein [Hyphomicrobiales bacterium]
MVKLKFFKAIFSVIFICFLAGCGTNVNNSNTTDVDTAEKGVKVDSIAVYTEQLKSNPTNVDLLLNRALLYLKKEEFDNALHDLNKTFSVEPKSSKAFMLLSDVYYSQGKLDRCIEALNKSISIDSDNMLAQLRLAEVYLLSGKYSSSLEEIEKCLTQDEDNCRAFYLMGFNFKLVGDTTRAIKAFQKAAELKHDYIEPNLQLGILYTESKNIFGKSYLDRAINIDPERSLSFYLRGCYNQKIGEYDKAIQDYDKAMQLDPKYVEAMYNKAYINLVYKEDFQSAVYLFSDVLKQDKNYSEALYNRGHAYELLGDLKNAEKDFRSVLKLNPNYQLAIDGMNRLIR